MPKDIKTSAKEIKMDILNIEGQKTGLITLPSEIFGVDVNQTLIAQAVRVYLANQRTGLHNTKTRSEVIGSTKKIYKQKGTGRARHGDIKAPIFVGGGVAHGPKSVDYSLNMSKQQRRKALIGVLSDKLKNGKISIIDGLEEIKIKTREFAGILKNTHLLEDKKKIKLMFVVTKEASNAVLSGRNIKGVRFTGPETLNTYEVLRCSKLVFSKNAVNKLIKQLTVKEKSKKETMVEKKLNVKEEKIITVKKEIKKTVKTAEKPKLKTVRKTIKAKKK